MAGRRKEAPPPPPGYRSVEEDEGEEFGAFEPPDLGEGAPLDLVLAFLPRNDLGNAKRLIRRHGDKLLYVKSVGWHAWHEGRWSLEEGERRAELLAQDVVEKLRDEAACLHEAGPRDDEGAAAFNARIKAAFGWAVTAGNSGRITGLLARAQAHLMVGVEAMDTHVRKFNVANGTLVLGDRRPMLIEHDPKHLATMKSDVLYDPKVEARPVFDTFIERVLPNDEVRRFLQRYLGYCLTGLGVEQSLVMLVGGGANGKSTLVDAIAHVMGEYGATLNIKSLLRDDRASGSQATPDLARLPGKRFVRTSEPEPGAKLAEGKIKELTGGEKITARHLNEGFFEFTPHFKLVVSMNNKPTVTGGDDGIWRRVLIVPFDVQIPKAERDKTLPDQLRKEASAILNWLLDGYEQWREIGLAVPDEVRAATQAYREENDLVGEFLAECVMVTRDLHDRRAASALYGDFAAWCKQAGREPIHMNSFGRKMRARADIKFLKSGGHWYCGLKVFLPDGSAEVGDPNPPGPPHDEADGR